MFERFTRVVWGHFSHDELKKFFGLALAAFFLIGAQWPVKSLKDSLLVNFLGAEYQPNIKLLSILICFPITIVYTILVEYFRKEKIIYLIAGSYAVTGAVFALLLKAWTVGLITNITLLANAFYLFAESLTAISIAPFWSFVNDITNPEEAKRGYGIIVFFAQLGGLVFTVWAKYIPRMLGYFCNTVECGVEAATPFITLTSSILLILFMISIWETVRIVKRSALEGYKAKNDTDQKNLLNVEKFSFATFLNGLLLIASKPYVAGVFLLTAFQEISGSLMQYYLLRSVQEGFASKLAVNNFIFDNNVGIQIVAVVFSLVGTSWFQRNIGIRGCLLGYPSFLLLIFATLMLTPNVYVIAVAVALAKGLHYALNKPVREILYIPTSLDIKYRSKAWIEVFGSRAAKAAGAGISRLSQTVPGLLGLSFVAVPLVWLGVAKVVGDKYHSSVINKEKIS